MRRDEETRERVAEETHDVSFCFFENRRDWPFLTPPPENLTRVSNIPRDPPDCPLPPHHILFLWPPAL